jgi:hypothetical protein
MCIAAEKLCHLKGVPTSACRGILAATNLLGKPLKSFIVNPADLPRKGVKRLATSGERVNYGSRVKMYKLCRLLKNYYNSHAHGHEWPEKLTE